MFKAAATNVDISRELFFDEYIDEQVVPACLCILIIIIYCLYTKKKEKENNRLFIIINNIKIGYFEVHETFSGR